MWPLRATWYPQAPCWWALIWGDLCRATAVVILFFFSCRCLQATGTKRNLVKLLMQAEEVIASFSWTNLWLCRDTGRSVKAKKDIWGGGEGGGQRAAKSTNLKQAARIFPPAPEGIAAYSRLFYGSALPFSAAPLQRVPALAEFKSGAGGAGGGFGGKEAR